MSSCESVAWCSNGRVIPLRDHLMNTANALVNTERLWSPVKSADKAFSKALGTQPGIVKASAVAAAYLHDIGKGCRDFVLNCRDRGKTWFTYHEIYGASAILHAGKNVDEQLRPMIYLVAYGVLTHHHAMLGRGADVFPFSEIGEKIRRCEVNDDLSVILMEIASGISNSALGDEVAPLVKEVIISVAKALGSLNHFSPDDLLEEWRGVRRLRRCRGIADFVRVSLFRYYKIPPSCRAFGVIRRAGFTITGVLSAADTLVANRERGGGSVFAERLRRELDVG